jgi:hypothetical protein
MQLPHSKQTDLYARDSEVDDWASVKDENVERCSRRVGGHSNPQLRENAASMPRVVIEREAGGDHRCRHAVN